MATFRIPLNQPIPTEEDLMEDLMARGEGRHLLGEGEGTTFYAHIEGGKVVEYSADHDGRRVEVEVFNVKVPPSVRGESVAKGPPPKEPPKPRCYLIACDENGICVVLGEHPCP